MQPKLLNEIRLARKNTLVAGSLISLFKKKEDKQV